MIAASTNPGQEMRAARAHSARRRVRSGAEGYVAAIKAQLAITEAQSQAWAAFAATLSANSRRMQRTDDEDQPFGHVEDRLTALGSMRRAAADLFPVLRAEQQCKALHLLPLCCLPPSHLIASFLLLCFPAISDAADSSKLAARRDKDGEIKRRD